MPQKDLTQTFRNPPLVHFPAWTTPIDFTVPIPFSASTTHGKKTNNWLLHVSPPVFLAMSVTIVDICRAYIVEIFRFLGLTILGTG